MLYDGITTYRHELVKILFYEFTYQNNCRCNLLPSMSGDRYKHSVQQVWARFLSFNRTDLWNRLKVDDCCKYDNNNNNNNNVIPDSVDNPTEIHE